MIRFAHVKSLRSSEALRAMKLNPSLQRSGFTSERQRASLARSAITQGSRR
jgi:hypothetical protein